MAQVTDSSDLLPFGLRRKPFQPTADPDFFFPGAQAAAALEQIRTALRGQRGVCVLTGETGTGKTTVLRKIHLELASGGGLVLSSNAPLSVDELIPLLGATSSASTGEERLAELARRLRELADEGRPVHLAIDEAQALDAETLGQVIGLLGRGSEPGALASLLLVGQRELSSRLQTLADRGLEIAAHCSLGPLSFAEVSDYIAHRLATAGAAPSQVFSSAAVERIADLSGGFPRFVNLLCGESLAFADRARARRIDPEIVDRVAEDLGFVGLTLRPEPSRSGDLTSDRAISRYRLLWAGLAVAAVAVLLLLPWLPRAIRSVPPAVNPVAVESSPEPPGGEARSATRSTIETPEAGATLSGPPPTDLRSGTDTIEPTITPPRRETAGARVARPAREAPAPARRALRDRGQDQALLLRVESGDLPGVRALLAAGESPDAPDRRGFTPLMLAAIHGHLAIGDALLNRGAAVNARNGAGQTALVMAAINNRPEFAARLLDRGASVNARTAAGWTALMYAAWEGHPEVARMLLARGADASLRDQAGWTAQRYVAWRVSPPRATTTGGVVTGIDNVEASLRPGSGHAAVLALLAEPRPRR